MADIFDNTRNQYERLMAEADRITPSPSERAEVLYKYLQTLQPKPTIWDMVCFAGELLTVACEDLPAIQPNVKQLISQIYTAHYNVGQPFASSVRSYGEKREPEHIVQSDGRSGDVSSHSSRPPLTLLQSGNESEAEPSIDSERTS